MTLMSPGVSRGACSLSRRSEALLWSLQSFTSHSSRSWQGFFTSASFTLNVSWPTWEHDHHRRFRSCHRRHQIHSDASRLPRSHPSQRKSLYTQSRTHDKLVETLVSSLDKDNDPASLIRQWKRLLVKEGPTALQIRDKLYTSLSQSRDDSHYEDMISILEHIPEPRLTAADYEFQISILIRNGEFDMVALIFERLASKDLPKEFVLEVLHTSLKHILGSATERSLSACFDLFSSTVLKTSGSLELLKHSRYQEERALLKTVLQSNPSRAVEALGELLRQKSSMAGPLATSCIDIFGAEMACFEEASRLWNLKVENELATALDLHRIMTVHYMNHNYKAVINTFENHNRLHEVWQFDIILLSYAKLQDFDGLQTTFELLFRYPSLPNLKHYGIVMQALSMLGNISVAEALFKGIVDRKINPGIQIFHALMYTSLALGDSTRVQFYYDQMAQYGIVPSSTSYQILLMAYRDSRDNDRALKLVGKMAVESVPISREVITTVLSGCTQRRDPETARALYNWALSYGLRPDVTMLNALIACYMESDRIEDAERIYEQMKRSNQLRPRIDTVTSMLSGYSRYSNVSKAEGIMADISNYGLQPDLRWYTSLMHLYVTSNQLKKAEEIMYKQLPAADIDPNSYVYSILMEGYIRARDFESGEKLFANMKKKRVGLTFTTQAKYLRMKTANPKLDVRNSSLDVLRKFVESDEVIDLTSQQLPRNMVPVDMMKRVVRELIKTQRYEEALLFVEPFTTAGNYDDKSKHKATALLLEIYGKARFWSLVDRAWADFVKQVRLIYVPTKQEDGTFSEQIPSRYSRVFDKAIDCRLDQLIKTGRGAEVLQVRRWASEEGFRLGSGSLNKIVQGLLSVDSLALSALKMAEMELAPNRLLYIRKSISSKKRAVEVEETQQKQRGGRSMPMLTPKSLRDIEEAYEQVVNQVAYERNTTRMAVQEYFAEEFPTVMKLLKWRQTRRGHIAQRQSHQASQTELA